MSGKYKNLALLDKQKCKPKIGINTQQSAEHLSSILAVESEGEITNEVNPDFYVELFGISTWSIRM